MTSSLLPDGGGAGGGSVGFGDGTSGPGGRKLTSASGFSIERPGDSALVGPFALIAAVPRTLSIKKRNLLTVPISELLSATFEELVCDRVNRPTPGARKPSIREMPGR